MAAIENLAKAATIVFGGRSGGEVVPNSAVQAAIGAQGMDTTGMLGPGTPIYPADGISTPPRSFDYTTGYNIAARPRSRERVSFWTLKGIIDSYDIAQLCITHRIDSLRSTDWSIVPEDDAPGDLSEQIAAARRFFEKPDGRLPFKAWVGKYLWDILGYDAGCLYKQRNNAGRLIGLKVVDGLTVAPLIDDMGDTPTGDAPAFVQFIQGQTWNWLLDTDIVYVPYRPQPDSMYGRSPIESVLLTANTDLRFQAYFMQQFTAGNVPAGFGVAPDGWGPDQIAAFQSAWDALLLGDQTARQRIRWVPGGSSFDWATNNQNFSNVGDMPKWLLTKTAAAYHVTPADLGFTETVNKSSGESQADVQNRVGDLPLKQHLADIFTQVMKDEFGWPLRFQFEDAQLEEDRLQTAQADVAYINAGVVSVSKVAEMRFGVTDPESEIVPRFVMTKAGPVALSTLFAASAEIDPETGAPEDGTTAPAVQATQQVVGADSGAPGVVADATGVGATPAASNPLVTKAEQAPFAELAKEAQAAEEEVRAFSRFTKSRRGKRPEAWRPFAFEHVSPVMAHRLNTVGYATVRKAAGEVAVAGLAVMAADTGRVLLIQRAVDPADPASGTWEFPGGHIEPGESPYEAAVREWVEETGLDTPVETPAAWWDSPNGIYAGFVIVQPTECGLLERVAGVNPDDPDGDAVEAIAWWEPAQLVNNPAVRPELSADLSLVLAALNQAITPPAPPEAVVDPFESAPLAKAWRDGAPKTPQHQYDLALTDAYAPDIEAVLAAFVAGFDVQAVADLLLAKADTPEVPAGSVLAALRAQAAAAGLSVDQLNQILERVYSDGWTTGQHAAAVQLAPHVAQVSGIDPATVGIDWGAWQAGNPPAADLIADGGMRALLAQRSVTIKGVSDSVLDQIGNTIASGLSRGDSIATIRGALGGFDLAGRAERIAHTESTRAVTAASLGIYDSNGVGTYDVVTSDGACEECIEIAQSNPYPVSDQDDAPPIHPYCRCSSAPNADSITDAGSIQFTDSEE